MFGNGSTLVHNGTTELYPSHLLSPEIELTPENYAGNNADGFTKSCRKGPLKQPPNTTEYKVKCEDKLTSLAAYYDTTPSALRKLNKLTVDYLYPDQLLYVPIVRQNSADSQCNSEFSSGSSDTHTDSDLYSGSSCEEEKPGLCSKRSSLQNSGVYNRTWVPEDSLRNLDLNAGVSDSSAKSSEDSQSNAEEQSPQQRFVKLPSTYIVPDKTDVVQGTLLVTPNAVMFDPYVSDPLVLEKGVEEFGMIAKMDTIIAAAIYRDGQAMHNLHLLKMDPTVSKPQIYHIQDCELHTDVQQDGTESNKPTDVPLSCSCAALQSVLQEESQTDTTLKEDDYSTTPDVSVNKVTFDLIDSDIDVADEQTNLCTADGTDSIAHKIIAETKFGHCRNVSSTSSICCVSVSSSTNIYVDYGCGMFAGNSNTTSADATTPSGSERRDDDIHTEPYQVSNDKDKYPVFLKAGVGRDEKPHLFKPICDLVPNASSREPSCQPFYLCLQVGERVNKCSIIDTCPIEAYKKKQRKPEYWFTIPNDRVDSLYNFFIQWRPELYGEEITDTAILGSRGFISIPENKSACSSSSSLPRSPMIRQLSHAKVVKDWELLSLDEIARRNSLLDLEKYLPRPDMQGTSLLLSDQNINQLAASVPARVEGHQWRLAYSNEDNGFSLNTLYRNMCEYDSATILLVQDENNGLFGAFSSSPLLHREHFYGNGECFLFTFVDGFKTYKWTSKNLFCIRGGSEGITIGTGSATCGLWVDAGLYHGRTQRCDTFDNEPLTGGQEDFLIKAIEVWSLSDEDLF